MPTSAITVIDQPTGEEAATQSFVEDAVTKHIQRVQVDQRQSSPPRRFSLAIAPTGGVTAVTTIGTNIGGIMAGAATVYIKAIQSVQYNQVAGTIVPIGVKRATTLAAGTLVTASAVPKHQTAAADSNAVVRFGAVTGVEAPQRLMLLVPQGTLGAINAGGASALWVARSLDDCIVLLPNEALIFDVDIASDTDNRYNILLSWEEVA